MIAGKWKVKIICHLFDGTKRFSEAPVAGSSPRDAHLRTTRIVCRWHYPSHAISHHAADSRVQAHCKRNALRPVLKALQRWATFRSWKYLLHNRIRAISQGHDVFSKGQQILSFESKKGNLRIRGWVRPALRLLNAVDLQAVQTSDGGRVEPRAGIYFGVCAGPIGINGSTRQGFESEAAIDVRCLSESLSNCLGDLLGHGIANVQDQVKTNLCTPMRC